MSRTKKYFHTFDYTFFVSLLSLTPNICSCMMTFLGKVLVTLTKTYKIKLVDGLNFFHYTTTSVSLNMKLCSFFLYFTKREVLHAKREKKSGKIYLKF